MRSSAYILSKSGELANGVLAAGAWVVQLVDIYLLTGEEKLITSAAGVRSYLHENLQSFWREEPEPDSR